MINNVTLGQFIPGNSFMHKIDPRIKIILSVSFLVSIFLASNYIALLINLFMVVNLVLLSGISFKMYLKSMRFILFIILFTSILNVFYSSGEVLFNVGVISITKNGVNNCIFVALRLIMIILISSLLTFTTSPTDLTDALERLMKPLSFFKLQVHELAMMMTIALRFVPTLLEETNKIISAQKARGADMESGTVLNRIKSLVPVFVPLFISSFRRAYDLALAMECRCYNGGNGRTRMKVLRIKWQDIILLSVIILMLIFVIFSNVYFQAVKL